MIKFQKVTKIFYSKKEPIVALEDVSFEVKEGEFISIVGRSGAGKTTMVKLLVGEERPTAGNIFFKDLNVCEANSRCLQGIRKRMGVVYQDYKLLFTKTVEENLSYIMQVIGVSDESIKRDIPKVLEMVGLEERTHCFPLELSGGEKQRLAIARSLIHRPEVVVADEPTGNLDPYNTYEVLGLFRKINELGTTVILLTHNKEIINSLKKRVITLEKGRVISDDSRGKFML